MFDRPAAPSSPLQHQKIPLRAPRYFAAVNGTTISIYNTYTCDNVGNLRGHNGKVRGVGVGVGVGGNLSAAHPPGRPA